MLVDLALLLGIGAVFVCGCERLDVFEVDSKSWGEMS